MNMYKNLLIYAIFLFKARIFTNYIYPIFKNDDINHYLKKYKSLFYPVICNKFVKSN
jgi:hypothetical protein